MPPRRSNRSSAPSPSPPSPSSSPSPSPPSSSASSSSSSALFSNLTFSTIGVPSSLSAVLSSHGGEVSSSVLKSTDYLVGNSLSSAKSKKAIEYQIPIVTSEWVEESIKKGSLQMEDKYFIHRPNTLASSSSPSPSPPSPTASATTTVAAASGKKGRQKRKADNVDDGKDTSAGAVSSSSSSPSPPTADANNNKKKSKGGKAKSDASDPSMSSSSPSPSSSSSSPSLSPPPVSKSTMKTITVKGRAPVDDLCDLRTSCHVYDEPTCVWDACLQQTNIGNNNNKFYFIQLLQSDDGKQFHVFNRWGRVGANGQQSTFPFGTNINGAKAAFMAKFSDKTKNNWNNRSNFHEVAGKYTLVERDYTSDVTDNNKNKDENDEESKKSKKDYPPSSLDSRVQSVVSMICNVDLMKKQMTEMGYDADKLPLGRLSKDQIAKGYKILSELSEAVDNSKTSQFEPLSNKFYSHIPHRSAGMRPPPVIRAHDQIKTKLELLDSLSEASVATRILNAESDSDNDKNPIDTHYEMLKCDMAAINHDEKEFQWINQYVQQTHATTHSSYDLEVLNVFKLNRHGEDTRFSKFSHLSNHQLLFHGSRATNFMGILSQGLRIAPPEAPATGYMFGKGIYTANMSSKSANYCFASSQLNVGFMLLNQVALGNMYEILHSQYMDKPPSGFHSTKGCGKNIPDPKESITIDGNVLVPLGKQTECKSLPGQSSLLYDEFIVYDTEQIKMKYLIQVKFNFKHGQRW